MELRFDDLVGCLVSGIFDGFRRLIAARFGFGLAAAAIILPYDGFNQKAHLASLTKLETVKENSRILLLILVFRSFRTPRFDGLM